MIYPLLGSLMSLHGALPLAVADGMPRLVTFFPELMGQDYAFFVVELLGGTSGSPGSEQKGARM